MTQVTDRARCLVAALHEHMVPLRSQKPLSAVFANAYGVTVKLGVETKKETKHREQCADEGVVCDAYMGKATVQRTLEEVGGLALAEFCAMLLSWCKEGSPIGVIADAATVGENKVQAIGFVRKTTKNGKVEFERLMVGFSKTLIADDEHLFCACHELLQDMIDAYNFIYAEVDVDDGKFTETNTGMNQNAECVGQDGNHVPSVLPEQRMSRLPVALKDVIPHIKFSISDHGETALINKVMPFFEAETNLVAAEKSLFVAKVLARFALTRSFKTVKC